MDDIRFSRKRQALVMIGVMLGMSLSALDQTVVGTAMPRVVADLNGMERYAWVFAAYLLASTIMVPIYGKLSDIYGRRVFFLGGMSLFLLGSACSGASQDMTELILFRAVQGLGAGAVMPMVQAIVGDMFTPIERGKWQGLIMSLWGIATIIGPALGGWITDYWGWRWVFYVNLPVGGLAILTTGIAMPAIRQQAQHSIDYRGSLLLVLAAIPLLLGLSWGGTQYPWLSIPIAGLLTAAAVLAVLFFRAERRAVEPIVNFSFFGNSTFAGSVAATFLLSVGMFSALVYTPLFVQGVMGIPASEAGTIMTAHMLAFAASNVIGGQILSRTGRYKAQALVCLAATTLGMALLALMDLNTTRELVVRNVIVLGLGLGILNTLFTIAVQNAFPPSALGQVTSNLQFFRSIGASVGTAILGSIMITNFQAQFRTSLPGALTETVSATRLTELLNPQILLSAETMRRIEESFGSFGSQGPALFEQLMYVVRSSLAGAIAEVLWLSTIVIGLAFFVSLFLRDVPLRSSHHSDSTTVQGHTSTASE